MHQIYIFDNLYEEAYKNSREIEDFDERLDIMEKVIDEIEDRESLIYRVQQKLKELVGAKSEIEKIVEEKLSQFDEATHKALKESRLPKFEGGLFEWESTVKRESGRVIPALQDENSKQSVLLKNLLLAGNMEFVDIALAYGKGEVVALARDMQRGVVARDDEDRNTDNLVGSISPISELTPGEIGITENTPPTLHEQQFYEMRNFLKELNGDNHYGIDVGGSTLWVTTERKNNYDMLMELWNKALNIANENQTEALRILVDLFNPKQRYNETKENGRYRTLILPTDNLEETYSVNHISDKISLKIENIYKKSKNQKINFEEEIQKYIQEFSRNHQINSEKITRTKPDYIDPITGRATIDTDFIKKIDKSTEYLQKAWSKIEEKKKQHFGGDAGFYYEHFQDWLKSVPPYAVWDIKNQHDYMGGYKDYQLLSLGNKDTYVDVPGNIMYGYSGTEVGLPSSILLSGAAGAQVYDDFRRAYNSTLNTSNDYKKSLIAGLQSIQFQNTRSMFEDPRDQLNIYRGIKLHEITKGRNITKNDLNYIMNNVTWDGNSFTTYEIVDAIIKTVSPGESLTTLGIIRNKGVDTVKDIIKKLETYPVDEIMFPPGLQIPPSDTIIQI